jgi:hypothetical protein
VTHWLSIYKEHFVRFQVLTTSSMKMVVFWVVVPCSLVEVYRRFSGAGGHHNQGIPVVGGSPHLWNVCKLLADDTAQQPRRQPSSSNALVSSNSDRKRWRPLPLLIQRTSDEYVIKPTALTKSVMIYLNPRALPIRFRWWIMQWYCIN